MKRTLLFLALLYSLVANSAIHYVAATGGTFTTLAEVNAHTFVAGDQILFNRGETFYGSLTISQSGTSGNPIIIGAYGTGVNPIITGFTTVTAWTNQGSNIWESTSSVSTLSTCNLVAANDVNTAMGRYPNADATNGGYFTFQSHSGLTSVTTSSLTGTPNWTGAEIRVRCSAWSFGKSVVTSQSGGTLNFSALDSYEPQDGFGFFLQNDLRTLDQAGEWYYNPSTKKLSIYATSQPTNVKVASIENLLTINGDYVNVSNVTLSGANSYVLYNASSTVDHITISNCSILNSGNATIQFRCAFLDVQNNEIAYANNKGVGIDNCSNVTFKGNNVHDISKFAGMGKSGNGAFSGMNGYYQSNVLIEGNTFTNLGMAGIEAYGDNITIKNNLVNTFAFVLDDTSGIYTFVGGGTPFTMVRIEGNIVLNAVGALYGTNYSTSSANGIYLDDNSNNVEVLNNTVSGCAAYGIYLHNTNHVNVHHNTVYDNKTQLLINDNSTGGVVELNTIKHNNFISKTAAQLVAYITSNDNNITSFAVLDSNYYARPIQDDYTFTINQPSTGVSAKTLAEWKTFSSQDSHSLKSPFSVALTTDLRLDYNATATVSDPISLGENYRNLDNADLTTVTLQPYSSIFLMKHAARVTRKPITTTEKLVVYHKKSLMY